MTLENKYNVPRETIQRMVNDGVIPCSVKRHYEIYDMFQRFKNECPSCTVVALTERISNETTESFENVRKIIYTFGKKS
jgi:hypothetical protein